MLLKGNDVVSFKSKGEANTFYRFFSNLADLLLQNPSSPKNKFGIKITEEYYKQSRNENFVTILFYTIQIYNSDNNLKNLVIAKASEIGQISAKFFQDGASVIAILLNNITNL